MTPTINKSDNNTPLYNQIYLYFRQKILNGEIMPGTALPATRKLAENLGVSRNTVNNAYSQLLFEGYVDSKAGSGYIVNDVSMQNIYTPKLDVINNYQTPKKEKVFKYDFGSGRASVDIFPVNEWKRCLNRAFEDLSSKQSFEYPERQGEYVLREAISNYIYTSRGIECRPSNIIINSGLEDSIQNLLFALNIKNPKVSIENPGYHSARKIFHVNGCNIIPAKVNADGIDMEDVFKADSNLMYVTPSHQFPTGAIMSIQNRIKAIEWARNNNSYIIEDDYDSELRYNAQPSPTLYSLDRNNRTVYLGTFSKSLSPDIRISFMILPDDLMYNYYKNTYVLHCNVSSLMQTALAQFISNGGYSRHISRLATSNKRKNAVLTTEIKKIFGDKAKIYGDGAGHHILLEVDSPKPERELLNEAADAGIKLHSISKYWANSEEAPAHTVMMGYGGINVEKIPEAVQILYQTWFNES